MISIYEGWCIRGVGCVVFVSPTDGEENSLKEFQLIKGGKLTWKQVFVLDTETGVCVRHGSLILGRTHKPCRI